MNVQGGGSLTSTATVDSSHGPSPRYHIMTAAICSLSVSLQRIGSSPGHRTKSGEAQALPRDSRRKACLSLAAFSAWAAKRATAVQSPYEVTTAEVGLVNGRIRGCPATFNCVSSAARSSDQYESPWVAPEPSLSAAAELLVAAVTAVSSAAVVVTSEATADGYYVRIQAPGRFDQPDELEFMFLPEGKDAALVTLRSCAGGVKCACLCVPAAPNWLLTRMMCHADVYPFMQPIGDGDLQRKRLQAVREKLGWPRVGCSSIECYE